MKKFLFCSLILATLLPFSSCNKKKSVNIDSDSLTLELKNGNIQDLVTEPQKWHITNKKICVVFGYNFNSPEIIEEYTALLEKNFGLNENGGLIYPLVYPSDFKHGAKGYANDFLTTLQDDSLDFCGVVLLGAPENTHKALAKNQDKWNQNMPYPVVALFPQDEVLGIEATCDIVLDKGQTNESLTEETEVGHIPEAPDVLVNTINYLQCLSSSIPNGQALQTHVAQMFKNNKIVHYVDPETGLQSINHFVLN